MAADTVDGEASPVTARKDRKSKTGAWTQHIGWNWLPDPPPHFFTATSSHTREKDLTAARSRGFFLGGELGTKTPHYSLAAAICTWAQLSIQLF